MRLLENTDKKKFLPESYFGYDYELCMRISLFFLLLWIYIYMAFSLSDNEDEKIKIKTFFCLFLFFLFGSNILLVEAISHKFTEISSVNACICNNELRIDVYFRYDFCCLLLLTCWGDIYLLGT